MAQTDSSVFIAGRKKKGVGGFISPEIQNKNISSMSKQLFIFNIVDSQPCENLLFLSCSVIFNQHKSPGYSYSPLNCGFLSCGLKGVILG